jgi:hypothetical protein
MPIIGSFGAGSGKGFGFSGGGGTPDYIVATGGTITDFWKLQNSYFYI